MKSATRQPKAIGDFRRALEDPTVDAVSIATPDHWHAPMAILAMKAGKHVYVEKPCGHNAREGELLVAAQRETHRVVQMGTQQRSSARTIEALQRIKDGVIGRPYLARAWYANTRVGIGKGKAAPVPKNLDYDLWQGPAPRTPYRDNVIHYNWHWFTHWGTGEICNNGTHEIDIARLALGVEHPTRVLATGGRRHYEDDWQFPDSQEATFEFAGGKTIIWQSESCNGCKTFDRSRGTAVYGTSGTLVARPRRLRHLRSQRKGDDAEHRAEGRATGSSSPATTPRRRCTWTTSSTASAPAPSCARRSRTGRRRSSSATSATSRSRRDERCARILRTVTSLATRKRRSSGRGRTSRGGEFEGYEQVSGHRSPVTGNC